MSSNNEEQLKREIGQWGFAAITLNGLIGGGIFALPAIAAAYAGNFSPWMFVISGVLFLTVVLSFAVAASMFRNTGGPSVYVGNAFGKFAGFQTGWLLWLGRVSAMAANTNLMVTYSAWFLPSLEGGWQRAVAIVGICMGLTVVNIMGVKRGMTTLFILTVLKLVPLLIVVVIGLAHVSPQILVESGIPAPDTLGETILLLFYAFVGFEGGVVNAGEGKNPRRDIPSAIIKTVIVTTLLYFLIQWVSISVLPDVANSKTPLADVAAVILGAMGAGLLTLGAILSIGGNLSATMISAPRMTYALAHDGSLPAWFGMIMPRYASPANSILFVGVLSTLLALSNTFVWLAIMSTLARLLGYLLCIASLWKLQQTSDQQATAFTLPGGKAIPVLAIAICLWLVFQANSSAWFAMLGFILVGSALFWFSRKSRQQAALFSTDIE